METQELLESAAFRAELLAVGTDAESDEYFRLMGLEDEDTVMKFCRHHAMEVFKVRIATSPNGVSVSDVSIVAMMFGLTVGYQLAKIQEENGAH